MAGMKLVNQLGTVLRIEHLSNPSSTIPAIGHGIANRRSSVPDVGELAGCITFIASPQFVAAIDRSAAIESEAERSPRLQRIEGGTATHLRGFTCSHHRGLGKGALTKGRAWIVRAGDQVAQRSRTGTAWRPPNESRGLW